MERGIGTGGGCVSQDRTAPGEGRLERLREDGQRDEGDGRGSGEEKIVCQREGWREGMM